MTTNGNNCASNVIDAIEIVANSVVSSANYDKTIIGTVLICTDAETGKYKVQFQDAYYYASVNNPEDSYKKGDNVYVLIPGNNLTAEKKILGLVENLGQGYAAENGIESQYEAIGGNVITNAPQYPLGFSYCSWGDKKPAEDGEIYPYDVEDVLYDVDEPATNKLIIDTVAFASFARSATQIQLSAKVKTSIPSIQERGNFGLKFELEFYTDLEGKETTIKTFILDTNSMVGTFYSLSDYLHQQAILDFNGAVFNRIIRITAFTSDFYLVKEKTENDIFFDDIGIVGMVSSTSNEWNTYHLQIESLRGNSFSDTITEIPLTAKAMFKNRLVEGSEVGYYWFLQNSAISSKDKKYCEHGGAGWHCLNSYNETDQKWIDNANTLTIKSSDMLGESAQYKCVIVSGGKAVAAKEFTIFNTNAQYYIEMKSSLSGDAFYMDQGTANITCTVKDSNEGNTLDPGNFEFHWGRLNSQGNAVSFIPGNGGIPSVDKTISNTEKKTTKEVLDILTALKDYMRAGFNETDATKKIDKTAAFLVKDYEDKVEGLNQYIINVVGLSATDTTNEKVCNKIESFLTNNSLSYVKDNIFHNLKGSIITEKNTFTCTVFQRNVNTSDTSTRYVGTGKIDIFNISSPSSAEYYLILKNHNQVFKYNAQGKSPLHRTNATPQTVNPLTFEFFDKNHTKIDLSKSESAIVRWWVPINDTLIQYTPPDGTALEDVEKDPFGEYYLVNGVKLPFSIVDPYSSNKINNDIYLEVSYNTFYTKIATNLSFIKEGENGTNGTDYYCRIAPNSPTSEYPTVYCWKEGDNLVVRSNFIGNLDSSVNNDNLTQTETTNDDGEKVVEMANAIPWFRCELWNSGIQLTPASVYWKILGNEDSLLTNSPFSLAMTDSSSELYLTVDKDKLEKVINGSIKAPFLVLQATVTYQQKKYYATQPIALVYFKNTNPTNRPRILANCGFNEAVYTSDGTNPQYAADSPFKLDMVKWDNPAETIEFGDAEWTAYGKEEIILKENSDGTCECDLPSIYNGLYVNNGILCKINNESSEFARMYFPINMYLNRYGHSHLNDWDGTSIKINNEEGYILTPQVGAGRKESDNTFTGMVMGEVKGGTGATAQDKVGLMGYGHGVQTMFLDAESGSAYFGKANEISIEPNGRDTKVKLGVWNLDNEAIWKNEENNERLFGGETPYFDLPEDKIYENLYFGSKGLSLNNKFVFFNQNTKGKTEDGNFKTIEAGTLKIGPWFVQNTSFWKGLDYLGGRYQKHLDDGGAPVEIDKEIEPPDPIEILPEKPQKEDGTYYTKKELDDIVNNFEKEYPNFDEETLEPGKDFEDEDEEEEFATQLEIYLQAKENLQTLNEYYTILQKYVPNEDVYNSTIESKALEEYKKAKEIYENELKEYNETTAGKKEEGKKDIYLGEQGFSLGDSFIYKVGMDKEQSSLTMNGKILYSNSTTAQKSFNQISYIDSPLQIFQEYFSIKGEAVPIDLLTLQGNKLGKRGTFISPNKVFFVDKDGASGYEEASFYYKPGTGYYNLTGAAKSKVSDNFFYFNRPLCVNGDIRITSSGVRVINWGSSDSGMWVAFGAQRSDASYNKIGGSTQQFSTAHTPASTYLRGRTLYLQAFGNNTGSGYNGTILGYATRFKFYNKGTSNPYISKSWSTKSDERLKNLELLDDRYYDFFIKLQPYAYTWKNNENGAKNIGYSAQQVKQALLDSNLTLNDFAGLSIDYDNEEGKEYGIEDFHTLNYEEFGPIYAAVLQRALKKIDELEERIKELEQ